MTRTAWLVGLAMGAVALAGCSTAPRPAAVAIAAPAAPASPYRWTQGDSAKSHKAFVATFHKVGMKPGDYVWATAIPKEGRPASLSIWSPR